MALHAIAASQLQFSEAGQFITRLFSDVEQLKIDLGKDKDLQMAYEKLRTQSKEYDSTMKQIRGMAETEKLIDLDIIRDQAITTLRRIIDGFEYSKKQEQKDAFVAASIIMKNYEDIERENYEKESYDIQRLLKEWEKAENITFVVELNLSEHLKNLQLAAADFDNVFNNRSSTAAQKITYDTKVMKRKMLADYTNIAKYAEACVPIKEDNALYVSLMEAINNGRRYFSDILARREGLAKAAKVAAEKPKE